MNNARRAALYEFMMSSFPAFGGDVKVVEVDPAVGFRPKARFACCSERRILNVEKLFAPEAHGKEIAAKAYGQRVPRLGWYCTFDTICIRYRSFGRQRYPFSCSHIPEPRYESCAIR